MHKPLFIIIMPSDFFQSQGRDNMIHIWELPNEQQNEPTRISSIVYNALGFCKLACDVKDTGKVLFQVAL